MEIIKDLTLTNFTRMSNKVNKYIVIHYVGAVSTARDNAAYFKKIYRGASANYFVDDNEIIQVVKDSDRAWHCGDPLKSGDGGHFNGICMNSNSIGIEMCCFNNNGTLDISEKTIANTIELVKYLMEKYNIPVTNVIRHYDVTNKICPEPFVRNFQRWLDFKARLTGEQSQNTPATTPSQSENTMKNKIKQIQEHLNNKYNAGLVVDGIFGPKTKKALIMALQTELNVQFGANLKVDGIFGPKTQEQIRTIKKGAKGNITYIVQALLICNGYDIAFDGDFGPKTKSAAEDYQSKNGLKVDGEVGKNTFTKMLS